MIKKILISSFILLLLGYLPSGSQVKKSFAPRPLAVLPFTYDGVHIIVHASIPPHKEVLNLIFDTGAEINVLDNTWFQKWNLKSTSESAISGFCKGMTMLPIVDVNALKLGTAKLAGQSFYIEDLSDLKAVTGRRIDGIIGYPVLKEYTIKIDFDHHTFSLYPAGKFPYSNKGQVIKIKMNFFTPMMLVSLPFTNGSTIAGLYHITTGGDYGILFNYPYVQKYHIDKSLQASTGTVSVKDMLRTTHYINGNIVALSIGRFHLRNVPTSYSPDIDDGNPNIEIAGAIGNDVWKYFNLILNYSEKEIYIEPDHLLSR